MPSILVTATGGPAGLNAVRSLKEVKGFRIISVDADPLASGLYLKGVKPYVVPLAKEMQYPALLLKVCRKEKVRVVLPCSDEETLALSESKELFDREGITVPIPDYPVVLRACDKWTMLKSISKLDVRTPKTFSPSSETEFERVLKKIDFPLVVRPRVSRGGRGVTYCKDKEAASLAFRSIKQRYGGVIVQELVPGGRGTVHVVQTLWDKHHDLCAAAVMQKLRERPPTGGVAVAGRTVHNDRLQRLGVSVMRKLGPWIGPAGVEFKVSFLDQQPYLMEVNPRLQGVVYLFTESGINFPHLWVSMALNERIIEQFEYKERYFIRHFTDLVIGGENLISDSLI